MGSCGHIDLLVLLHLFLCIVDAVWGPFISSQDRNLWVFMVFYLGGLTFPIWSSRMFASNLPSELTETIYLSLKSNVVVGFLWSILEFICSPLLWAVPLVIMLMALAITETSKVKLEVRP